MISGRLERGGLPVSKVSIEVRTGLDNEQDHGSDHGFDHESDHGIVEKGFK